MPMRRPSTRTVGNLASHSSRAKIKERRMLGMAVSILFPQDQSALIRKFYSNLFIYHEDSDGHYWTSWIRDKEFRITKLVVSEALGVPLVRKPHIHTLSFHLWMISCLCFVVG